MDLHYSDKRLQNPAWVQTQTGILAARYPLKIAWFLENGYKPNFYQLWGHCAQDDNGLLSRFRSNVAGRRGGKTLGSGWETAYYLIHPDQWWEDVRGFSNPGEDAHWWGLAKDHTVGLPSRLMFRAILKQCGMVPGKDYKENLQEKYFTFKNGRIDFRSAEDPRSLVGAGLNGIWCDESGKIQTGEAWEIVRPCLSDKLGLGIFSTTPEGKNWFFKEFHAEDKLDHDDITRIQWRSLDNVYFPKSEWDKMYKEYHPIAFLREYMGSFDAFAGVELPGEWLEPFYTWDELPRIAGRTGNKPTDFDLDYYIGCDPAISMADTADFFALSVIGIPRGLASQAYLIESVNLHISFAEQLDLIRKYQSEYRPQYIGIENVAYQRVLVEQAMRLDNAPNVIGIPAPGTKPERIISMSPAFRVGKVKIRGDQKNFIDEWLNYDTTNKNAQDDVLDSVEIALRTAGFINEDPIDLSGHERTVKTDDERLKDAIWKQQPHDTADADDSEWQQHYIEDVSHDYWMDM